MSLSVKRGILYAATIGGWVGFVSVVALKLGNVEAVSLFGAIVSILNLVLLIIFINRQAKTTEFNVSEETHDYDEFPYDIDSLRRETEEALYKECIAKIMKSKSKGSYHCYLQSTGSTPMPQGVIDKLLAYGLDVSAYSIRNDYWCEAFWDKTASGKMREYVPRF